METFVETRSWKPAPFTDERAPQEMDATPTVVCSSDALKKLRNACASGSAAKCSSDRTTPESVKNGEGG